MANRVIIVGVGKSPALCNVGSVYRHLLGTLAVRDLRIYHPARMARMQSTRKRLNSL
ncbi:MAG: hypothetical protein ABGX68_05795 [Methylococcales bacterium]